ncbi:MAG TPA: alpha/beta fold hydrolase [Kofleriaceae bacterium]|nr:alpha/beta fold hydrolase [Kofleriaceae bacterium]
MSTVLFALLALFVIIAVAVAAAIVLRPRKVAPAEGVEPIAGPALATAPLPVVLVHGLFGFDRIGVPGVKLHYFRGIVKHLESLGCHAHAVRLPAAASVPDRAKILVEKIAELGHDRVDIIAHSLGGLDARYALAKLGLAARVRSLVTIGTPHHGTPLANFATEGPLGLTRKALALVGMPMHALDWLSPAALERFNAEVPNATGVSYACVVAGIREPGTPVSLAIAPAHAYLRRVSGPNDGLVPIASQYWGETLAEIEADHFEQVGWRMAMRGTFDALALYAFILARLGDAPATPAQAAAS